MFTRAVQESGGGEIWTIMDWNNIHVNQHFNYL